jgi:hypothetical protein
VLDAELSSLVRRIVGSLERLTGPRNFTPGGTAWKSLSLDSNPIGPEGVAVLRALWTHVEL